MPTPFSGGCACGAVRYTCSREPVIMLNCHCRDCQRASGGPFSSLLAVPKETLQVTTGEAKYHTVTADSGNTISRGFCATCGSPLFISLGGRPDIVSIRAASLDDPSWFRPTMDIFTASAQPWDHMNPELTNFPRSPFPRAAERQ